MKIEIRIDDEAELSVFDTLYLCAAMRHPTLDKMPETVELAEKRTVHGRRFLVKRHGLYFDIGEVDHDRADGEE